MEQINTENLINSVINEVQENQNINSTCCSLCEKPMENNEPLIELLCHHKLHTRCFLFRDIFNEFDPECRTCRAPIFSQEIRDESRKHYETKQLTKKQKILKNFQENKLAKDHLKIIKKQIVKARKARLNLNKYFTSLRKGHQEEAGQLKKLLKDMIEKRKKMLKASEEYKNWKKEKLILLRYIGIFNQTHRNLDFSELALVDSLKIPSRWALRKITTFHDYYFYRMMRNIAE